jgi:N-acetyl-gamma-glutamyl-phosphate reductase/acetylglutamate kinase
MELAYVSSRELNGQTCTYYKESKIEYTNLSKDEIRKIKNVDAWIMALPNNVCAPFVNALLDANTASVILDLSADYRFNKEWTYGLPELYNSRKRLLSATKIANPGCYATGSQLGIYPLLKHLNGSPNIFGVSGYSGAGTKPSPNNDISNLKDNLIPYSLTGHMHEKEVSFHLNHKIAFTPHVASWFQGINLTISIPLKSNFNMNVNEIYELYKETFKNDQLIKIQKEIPYVKNISGKHPVIIGGFQLGEIEQGKRLVLVVTMDNLLKGAATQALQNLNLALGYKEYQGII